MQEQHHQEPQENADHQADSGRERLADFGKGGIEQGRPLEPSDPLSFLNLDMNRVIDKSLRKIEDDSSKQTPEPK